MNDATKKTAPHILPPHRIAYSAISERAPLKLPGGARMAVWVIVNVEEWDATAPMPRTVLTPPAGGSPSPARAHAPPRRKRERGPGARAPPHKPGAARAEATGARPRGWLGPGLTETWET